MARLVVAGSRFANQLFNRRPGLEPLTSTRCARTLRERSPPMPDPHHEALRRYSARELPRRRANLHPPESLAKPAVAPARRSSFATAGTHDQRQEYELMNDSAPPQQVSKPCDLNRLEGVVFYPNGTMGRQRPLMRPVFAHLAPVPANLSIPLSRPHHTWFFSAAGTPC